MIARIGQTKIDVRNFMHNPDEQFECVVGHKSKRSDLIIGRLELGGERLHCPYCFGSWLKNHISMVTPVKAGTKGEAA